MRKSKNYKLKFDEYGEVEWVDLNGNPLSDKEINRLTRSKKSLKNTIKELIREQKKAKSPTAHIELAQEKNPFRISDDYYKPLKLLRKKLDIKKAYYPGSESDITPSLIFDQTIILNINRLVHANLRVVLENNKLKSKLEKLVDKKIHKVILKRANAHKFKPPKDMQLLILINFTGDSTEILKNFRGDYTACNSFTDTAFNIAFHHSDEFELIGRVTDNNIVKPEIKPGIPLVKQIRFGSELLWLFKRK